MSKQLIDPLIKVTDLSIGWDDLILQKHATFEIERGDIFVIIGGSGCGKSTLLRYLIGLEKPMAGEVTIDGAPPTHLESGRPSLASSYGLGILAHPPGGPPEASHYKEASMSKNERAWVDAGLRGLSTR